MTESVVGLRLVQGSKIWSVRDDAHPTPPTLRALGTRLSHTRLRITPNALADVAYGQGHGTRSAHRRARLRKPAVMGPSRDGRRPDHGGRPHIRNLGAVDPDGKAAAGLASDRGEPWRLSTLARLVSAGIRLGAAIKCDPSKVLLDMSRHRDLYHVAPGKNGLVWRAGNGGL